MNRTAKCIKMLMLLSNEEIMNGDELARALDTNKRNIREYRKELEDAGFTFKITTGHLGGYHLENYKLRLEPVEN